MRVISGEARRTLLTTPTGLNTRPTSDRAKENLFNILNPRVQNARFLDIFSGSGAIGIEAMSRGASEAVFIENAPNAIAAIKQNLIKTRFINAEILPIHVIAALAQLKVAERKFDIIFLDPPYESNLLEEVLQEIPTLLAPHGIIVAETDKTPPPEISGLTLTNVRQYGRTTFLFFETQER